jgi:hypothetical protein
MDAQAAGTWSRSTRRRRRRCTRELLRDLFAGSQAIAVDTGIEKGHLAGAFTAACRSPLRASRIAREVCGTEFG